MKIHRPPVVPAISVVDKVAMCQGMIPQRRITTDLQAAANVPPPSYVTILSNKDSRFLVSRSAIFITQCHDGECSVSDDAIPDTFELEMDDLYC